MIDSFLRYIEYEKRYSPKTVISYSGDLKQFQEYLISIYEIHHLQEADFGIIRSWIVSLVDKGLGSKSINRKIATLRSYYKFLMRSGVIEKDPTLRIKAPKVKKALPVFVEEQSLIKLLDQVEYPQDFEGQRDKIVLELLYGTGIRLSELLGLLESDIDLHGGTIRVLGKGNKERIIPLNKSLIPEVENYVQLKKSTADVAGNTKLITTNKGKDAYPMLIYRIVKKYLPLVTSIDKKSPHVLRHSFATHLLDKGADLNAIKELLGHANLAATQVYTHNSLDKLKAIFKQAHPKA